MPTALPEHNLEYSRPGGPIVGVSLDPGLSPKMRPLTAASHTLWLLQARWLGATAFQNQDAKALVLRCAGLRCGGWIEVGVPFRRKTVLFPNFPFIFF